MSANIKASTDGTQAIIGVGGVDQMTVSNAGVVTANSFVGAMNGSSVTATGSSTARILANRFADVVNVKNFGAIGDGVVDDTIAIQNALDSNKTVLFPAGKYRVTSSLIISPNRNRNAGIIGCEFPTNYPYTSQSGGPTWDGKKECILFYDGPTSATTAVLLASLTAIGVQNPQTFDSVVFGLKLENIVIDGNNKAGFGVYAIRLSEPVIKNIVITNTTKHAFYLDGTYSGVYEKISAFKNQGCGISIGRGTLDYSWTGGNKVNALTISDLYASGNGSDKAFNETTNPLWGYGIGLWFHRGNTLLSYTSENNDGVGIVLNPTSSTNYIASGYSELSNSLIISGTNAITDGRATRKWGCWFNGDSVDSLNMRLCNAYMAAEGIRITGTQPSVGRTEGGFSLENITGANYLLSDWGNYRLINCAVEIYNSILANYPVGAIVANGGIKFNASNSALSFYNEDVFTPSLEGVTISGTGWAYGLQTGSYTRIGNRCFFTGRINLSSVSLDATGQIAISGLPFTIKNGSQFQGVVQCLASSMTTSIISMEGSLDLNTNRIRLNKRTAASASPSTVSLGDLSGTTSIIFTGQYVIA